MSSDADASLLDKRRVALEERRVALEELKEQHSHELGARELDLKRSESSWTSRLFTPLTTTVFAGTLTFAASAVGTLIQSHSALDLEREKFKANLALQQRKEQHELILKMVSVGNESQAKANLRFLAESQLIESGLASRILAMKDAPVLPSTGPDRRPRGIGSDARAELLGQPEFVVNGDGSVEFTNEWDINHIIKIEVPQLRGIPGAPTDGRVRFHKLAARNLQKAFEEIAEKGLLPDIQSWDGSYAPRLIRGSNSLSSHGLGIAFDINARWNRAGSPAAMGEGTVTRLVPIFEAHGFSWGGGANHPS